LSLGVHGIEQPARQMPGGNHGEIFYTLKEAQVLIEEWRLEYNTFRPHSALMYRTPAPEAWFH
jgi:transposase InsO family protein